MRTPLADMELLSAQWREQLAEATRLDAAIEARLKELGYGGEGREISLGEACSKIGGGATRSGRLPLDTSAMGTRCSRIG